MRESSIENDLQVLTDKIEELLEHIEQLRKENRQLRAHERGWREERAKLIEKNDLARHKVEAMILRLKALEQDS